jgi:hypothetical protein
LIEWEEGQDEEARDFILLHFVLCKHLLGTISGQIWVLYKELKAQIDSNYAKMEGPVQEVANTRRSYSAKLIFDRGPSFHMTLSSNCVGCSLSVRVNVVLAEMIQGREYWSRVGSSLLSYPK